MKILNRFNGSLLFESDHETMKETVDAAIATAADLRSADLSYADLSSADLRYANLRSANLSSADLSYADLSYADLSSADLSSADLRSANLSSADLRSANLSSADLSSADLRSANLRSADLSSADLSSANLSSADLSSANLRSAELPVLEQIQKIPIKAAICGQVCAAPEKLEMDSWHTCDTIHCIAGWTTTLHPQGKLLESIYGTSAAAGLIMYVCEGEIPDFHSTNEAAMEWLKSGEYEKIYS